LSSCAIDLDHDIGRAICAVMMRRRFSGALPVNFKSIDKIAHGKLTLETSPKDNIAYVTSAANLSEIAHIDIEVAFNYARNLPLQ
jgi:hypothetical protein